MLGKRLVPRWIKALGLCGLLIFAWLLTRFSFAEQPIPDWTTWKCKKPVLSHEIIETRECHFPGNKHKACIILRVRGANMPFLIGWDYDELAENPRANTFTALYKNGGSIVGARGTGFTTVDKGTIIIFYIFLAPDFSIREQIEIKLPEGKKNEVRAKLERK